MPRLLYIALIVILLVSCNSARAATYIDSQVVCQIFQTADPDTIAISVEAIVIDGIQDADMYLFSYRKSASVDSMVALLKNHPDVKNAWPNFTIKINLDDVESPQIDQTSQAFVDGARPDSFYQQYAGPQMLVDSAHLLNQGDGAVVAIIEGGLDISHPLFDGRLYPHRYDFIDYDTVPWVTDGYGANHGTFVAGIIARAAPEAQLMIVRSFSASGAGTSFDIAHGINYAAQNGASVINMSFGMDHYDGTIAQAIAIAYVDYGVVMTAAAGNSDDEIERFPGSHPYVLNVAAVNAEDVKASFSNYGPAIDVAAPGVNIYSALPGGDVWGWWSGTSFSAPFASALAALVQSVYPDEEPEMIIDRMLLSVDNIDQLNPTYIGLLGDGRLNFLQAIYVPGDANGSGSINIGDVVFLVNFVFRDGPAPIPPESGDANCDMTVDVGDAVYIINYIFRQGGSPGCSK